MTATTTVHERRVVSPALVGRGKELELLAAVGSEPPAVIVLEGEAGIGKTRLVSELAARPELGDRRFAVGCCRRIGEPFPLGPVVEVLRSQGEVLAGAALSPVAGALRPLLPELSHLLPEPPAPQEDRAAERHRVFRGLVEVLAALGPAVVVLEDLHWADEQTVEFVGYLLMDPPSELTLGLTFRGDEVPPLARTVTGALPPAVRRAHVVLSPLDEAETRALASAILGFERLSKEFASYLWERTSGLPFAIEELLALLRARGTLVRHGGSWVRRALDALDVPDGIRDAVLERASRLSGRARSVVDAAAVLQVPHPTEVLAATCGPPDGELLAGLEEALGSGLVVEDGTGVGFRHPLAAQAIYEAIPGPRRRRAHRRAASTLDSLDPRPLGQIAHHLRHAGQLAAWAEAAERAADTAVELGHDAEAARLLEEVLRHAPLGPDARGRVAVKLGRAATEAVHSVPEVADLLSEALAQPLPPAARGQLRFWLAMLLEQTGGDPAVRRRLYVEAVDDLGDRPDLQAWAMVGLGVPTVPGIPAAEHRRWLHRSLEMVSGLDDPATRVLLWGKAAMVLVAMGDPAWRELVDRIVAQTCGSPSLREEVNAYDSVGIEACYAGHHDLAERLLTAGREGAAGCESPQLELRARRSVALLEYCRGSWEGLSDRIRVLVDELAGYPYARVVTDAVAGCLTLAGGDLDEAHRRLAEVWHRAEELGVYDLLPVPSVALIRLLVARGEVAEAVAIGQRALAGVESSGIWAPATRLLPPVGQAMVVAGQVDEARALLDRAAGVLRELDAPLAAAAGAHARGFVTAASGDWLAAAGEFEAAAEGYQPRSWPYEAAQAREQAARCLLAADDPRGEAVLRAALAAYRGLGAGWDAGRATQLARQYGVSVPALHRGGRRGYGAELSPREREVAGLAALGRTNQEIARELYLSTRTVEKHVKAAMRKLRAPSRAAFAYQLSGADQARAQQR